MIEVTAQQIDRAERMLEHIPDAAPKALSRAINRAAEVARTEAARKVRETYYIRHQDVISTIKLHKASHSHLAASVTSRGHAIPLTRFRVTPKQPEPRRKRPIMVRVKRGEGGPIKSAFVAKMQSGHLGVFQRVGRRRTPIKEFYGPPIPQMLGNPSVAAWVEKKAAERLDERLEHEITQALEGYE